MEKTMKLLEPVKYFIEDNIEYIDKHDWKTVFKNWYIYDKEYCFDDFIEALEQAGIDVIEESRAARVYVLQGVSKVIFSNLSQMYKMITFDMMFEELNSLLGFEGQEFIRVLTPSARAIGLVRCSEGWRKP